MYLHRYPHTHTEYTRICTYPDSARSRHINRFGGGKKKLSHSCSHVSTIYGPQSHRCGASTRPIKMSAITMCLMTAYKLSPGAPQKPKRATLLYDGSRFYIFRLCVPVVAFTAGTLQGCGLNVQCCSIAVCVQNSSISGKNDPKDQSMFPMSL